MPEIRPKVRMVFFNVRLLWNELETLCGSEAVFVVMLLGDFGEDMREIMLWGGSLRAITMITHEPIVK